MNTIKREIIILGILFLVISAISINFYVEMNNSGVEKVPIHWNVHYEPDRFASPIIAVLIGPLTMLVIILATWRMSKKRHSDTEKKSTRIIILFVAALMVFVNWISLKAASGYVSGESADISNIHLGLGLVFVLIGNQFGKLRPSRWIGIRIPATLNNEEVWNRVHRKGGRLMVISGLCVITAVFFGEQTWSWIFYIPLFISIIMMIFVLPAIEKKKVEKEVNEPIS